MTIISRDKVCSLLTVAVGAFLLSCGNDSAPNPHLLDSEVEPEVLSEEERYLRSLQAVKYQVFVEEGCLKTEQIGGPAPSIKENTYFSARCAPDSPNPVSLPDLQKCRNGFGDGEPSPCEVPRLVNIQYFLGPNDIADQLLSAVRSQCAHQTEFEGCRANPLSTEPIPPCTKHVCETLTDLCIANSLLEITGERAEPLTIPFDIKPSPFVSLFGQPSSGFVTVPTQSTATKAALSETASLYARRATQSALQALQSASGISSPSTCAAAEVASLLLPLPSLPMPVGLEDRTHAQVLTSSIIEAYKVNREATERAVEQTVALADKLRSNPNAAEGLSLQNANRLLSRGRAARLLAVGDLASANPGQVNFCASAELNSAGRRALDLLRASGIAPSDVIARPGHSDTPIGLDDFLTGPEGSVPSGSVLFRLAVLNGVDPATAELGRVFGIRDEDFETARQYLAEEFRAFGRVENLGPAHKVVLPPGSNQTFDVFAATRHPPRVPNPIYYTTLAGSNSFRLPAPTNLVDAEGLASFSNLALSSFAELASATLSDDTIAHQIQDPLVLLIESERIENRGTWELFGSGPARLSSTVRSDKPFTGLVVIGEAGLSCAIDAQIEGVACELFNETSGFNPNLVVIPQGVAPNETNEDGSITSGFTTSEPIPTVLITGATRLYLVEPKTATAGLHPGNYQVVAGLPYPTSTGSRAPINPTLFSDAGELLTPNTKWCAQPTVVCDGTRFDARLPLEDELTDNNDGVESSWKYYLGLAKQAADEADLLGKEHIQAGLELDLRGEELELRESAARLAARNELETLQNACGASVDIQTFVEALQGTSGVDLGAARVRPTCPGVGECDCSPTASCPLGYTCETGPDCVVDLEQLITKLADTNSEMRRVADCLLTGERLAAVTAGDTPLCFFRDPAQPNQICQNADGTRISECPYANTTCKTDWEQTAAQLGYFHQEPRDPVITDSTETDPPQSESPIEQACTKVRKMRAGAEAGTRQDLGWLTAPDAEWRYLFSNENMRELSSRIGYEDNPGNYADLTVDGRTWKTTTNENALLGPRTPVAGTTPPEGEWPCLGVEHRAQSCGYADNSGWRDEALASTSLFCSVTECDDHLARSLYNRRLLEAVAFLRHASHNLDAPGLRVAGTFKTDKVNDLGSDLLYPFGTGIEGDAFNLLPLVRTRVRLDDCEANCTGEKYSAEVFQAEHPIWMDVNSLPVDANDDIYKEVTIQDAALSVSLITQLDPWGKLSRANPPTPDSDPELIADALLEARDPTDEIIPKLRPRINGALRSEGFGVIKYAPTFNTAYDALELACEVRARTATSTPFDRSCIDPPVGDFTVNSIEDLGKVTQHVSCMAGALEAIAANTLLFNFPAAAADALKQESATGAYPKIGGVYGENITAIRAALIELHDKGPKIASQVAQLSIDIEELKNTFQSVEVRKRINDANFMKETFAQVTACVTDVLDKNGGGKGVFNNLVGLGAPALSSMATCINSALQINLSAEINELQNELADIDKNFGLLDFRRNFEARADALRELGTSITTAQENLDGALIRIDSLQKAALRSLRDAIWLSTDQASQQYQINSVMRQRFSTSRVRYEEAHRHAKNMAFIAMRAVESRLGVRLSAMVDDLPLVGAPSEWQADICASAPVDYLSLREDSVEEDGGFEIPGNSTPNFADAFIGDYVRKLESVVESYRQVNGFHEGTDTAVLSLRDDIMRVKEECQVPSANLVPNSASLETGWAAIGCDAPSNCIAVQDLGEPPFDPEQLDARDVTGYRFTFGVPPTRSVEVPQCSLSGGCGLTEDSRYTAPVLVGSGKYVLSWYARQAEGPSPYANANPDGSGSVLLTNSAGTTVAPIQVRVTPPNAFGWAHYATLLDVPPSSGVEAEDNYLVAVVPDAQSASVTLPHQVDIAAIQLEQATNVDDIPSDLGVDEPLPFEATDGQGLRHQTSCPDIDGSKFRGTRWQRSCLTLCDTGFTGDCRSIDARQRCYQEASFAINQREIEQGTLLTNSGFASGNFNYRIETLGVNFVGTDIRNCAESEAPQPCYAGGFVQYSLMHDGPYFVRNYDGNDAEINLFRGNIEHARGLATERYITNPVSDSDQGLLDAYMRSEFRGRPLDGSFVVRIWEDENASFEQIEDVQIVLNYRYWTRFD